MNNIVIAHEDDDLLIIDKPSGLITHQKNINDTQPSVVSWVIENYPELKDVGDFFIASGQKVPRTGIVHRLDKDTSGLLVIAKNNSAFAYLQKLFHDRKITKQYVALVHGIPAKNTGTINSSLGRIGMKRTTQITGKKIVDKKEAETDYKVLKKFPAKNEVTPFEKGYSLVELTPKTGRTHQLRVHMKSIGHPIACDFVYGEKNLPCPPELGRLFLHAQKISFISPSGQSIAVEADLPIGLTNFINSLQE